MIAIGFGDAFRRDNKPDGQIRLHRFDPGCAGRASMLSSLAPQCVQLGESALVARAPGRDAVAQPVLLHRDLTAKLMLLVGFLREDRVAPSLKCRETLIQDARNATVQPYGAAREPFKQPPIMAN